MTYDTRTVIATAKVTVRGWGGYHLEDMTAREWQSGTLESIEPIDMIDFLANTDSAYPAEMEEPSIFDLKGEAWWIDGELVDLFFTD